MSFALAIGLFVNTTTQTQAQEPIPESWTWWNVIEPSLSNPPEGSNCPPGWLIGPHSGEGSAWQEMHPQLPADRPTGFDSTIDWWPLFGLAWNDGVSGTDPCDSVGSIVYVDSGTDGYQVDLDPEGVGYYEWRRTRSATDNTPVDPVADLNMGDWFLWYEYAANGRRFAGGQNRSESPISLWQPSLMNYGAPRIAVGSRSNFPLAWAPSPGDYINPAPTIAESAFALTPAVDADRGTDWLGAERATLMGEVDLITGAPLVEVNDLELDFGGATFRLNRTRAHGPRGEALSTRAGREDWQMADQFVDGLVHAGDKWYDWTGVGWMASENPLLVIDSARPDVVGGNARTTWFVPNAHFSIPFQQIESTGEYEAPPRFRARLTHNGVWSQNAWFLRPTEYKVTLYEKALSYTFVAIYEDVPPTAYWAELSASGSNPLNGIDNCPDDSYAGPPQPVLSSLHDRPFLGQDFRNAAQPVGDQDPRYSWGSWDKTWNPGFGAPYFGVCVRIEDKHENRVEITYHGTESDSLPGESGDCRECWETSRRKGQIKYVELTTPVTEPNGTVSRSTAWTLVYSHRYFRERELVHRADHAPILRESLTSRNTDALALMDVAPIDQHEELYAGLGDVMIDRIYVYQGDLPASVLSSAGVSIGQYQADDNGFDEAHDPLAGEDPALGGWDYQVRYFYDYSKDENTGETRHLPVPLLVKTTTETPNDLLNRRVYHYQVRHIHTPQDHAHDSVQLAYPSMSNNWEHQSGLPWLQYYFENDAIARIEDELGITGNELARWRRITGTSEAGIFNDDLSVNGAPLDRIRELADYRSDCQTVDVDGIRRGNGYHGYAAITSDDPYRPKIADLQGAQYLVLEPDRLMPDSGYEFFSGSAPWGNVSDITDTVKMLSLPDPETGAKRHFRVMKFVHLEEGDRTPEIVAFHTGDGGEVGFYHYHSLRHQTLFTPPYRRFGYTNPVWWFDLVTLEGARSWYTANHDEMTEQPWQIEAADLAEARWVTVVDEFESRESMCSTTTFYSGVQTAGSTLPSAHKPGQIARRVVEMNAAGYVLRDYSWKFGAGGVSVTGGGLGKQYIYLQGDAYFSDDQPEPSFTPGAPTGLSFRLPDVVSLPNDQQESRARLGRELILASVRSVGWSAAARDDVEAGIDLSQAGMNDGLVTVYQYAIAAENESSDSPTYIPWSERVVRIAEGVHRGRVYSGERTWIQGLAPRYTNQSFYDPERPTELVARATYFDGVESLAEAPEPMGSAPSNGVSWWHVERGYKFDDPQKLEWTKTVGGGAPTRPGGSFLYPIEISLLGDGGAAAWSASGLVANPVDLSDNYPIGNPSIPGDTGDPDIYLKLTYTATDESTGQVRYSVEDAEPDSVALNPFPPSVSSMPVNIPELPSNVPTGFGRLGRTPALNWATVYLYDSETEALTDIAFPNGRRWARRWIIQEREEQFLDYPSTPEELALWNPDDPDPELFFDVRTVMNVREFVFDGLELKPDGQAGEYIATAKGEVNGTRPNELFPLAAKITRKNVSWVTPASSDPDAPLIPTTIPVDNLNNSFDDETTNWRTHQKVLMAPDANGRIRNATLLEPSANGAMLAVGTQETNDLGEMYRSREIDGGVTRLTRNHLGQDLRRYLGSQDSAWLTVEDGGPIGDLEQYDMILVERTEYGEDVNDAWLPTVVREYRSNPTWSWDHHNFGDQLPASDTDGYATVTSYDWRMRPVRIDEYEKGNIETAARLRTTVRLYDHSDRVRFTAVYGESADRDLADIDGLTEGVASGIANLLAAESLYIAGAPLISLTEQLYDVNGHVYETRVFDPSWAAGSGSPEYLATLDFTRRGQTVFRQAPDSTTQLSVLDNLGRLVSTSDVRPDPTGTGDPFELSRTVQTLDENGNVIARTRFDRLVDDGVGTLTAIGTGANAAARITYMWYDYMDRLRAEVDLGASGAASYGPATATPTARWATRPSWDAVSGQMVDLAPVPPGARVTTYEYDDSGELEFTATLIARQGTADTSTDVAVTRNTYGKTGRLTSMIDNPLAPTGSNGSRETHYGYQWGRLAWMSSPRLESTDPYDDYEQITRVRFGAKMVDENFAVVSTHSGLIGAIYERTSDADPPVTDFRNTDYDDGLNERFPSSLDSLVEPEFEYTYTFSGKLAERRDRRGFALRYCYDALDRLDSIEVGHYHNGMFQPGYPAGHWIGSAPASLAGFIDLEYDGIGNLFRITSKATSASTEILGEVERAFNARGDLLFEWQQLAEAVNWQTSPFVGYGWDYDPTAGSAQGQSRLAKIWYPYTTEGGSTTRRSMDVVFGYGTAGSVEDKISRIQSIDAVSLAVAQLLQVDPATGLPIAPAVGGAVSPLWTRNVASMKHTGDGMRYETSLAGGSILDTNDLDIIEPGIEGLNVFGQASEDLVVDSMDTILRSSEFAHDGRGYITRSTRELADIGGSAAITEGRSEHFAYDKLGRLTEFRFGTETTPSGDPEIVDADAHRIEQWSFDRHGNSQGIPNPSDISRDALGRLGTLDLADQNAFTQAFDNGVLEVADLAPDYGTLDLSDITAFITSFNSGVTIAGHQVSGNLDGYGMPWEQPGADSDTDLETWTDWVTPDNRVTDRYESASNFYVFVEHDDAGNLMFDGEYYYRYDAFNRLITVHKAVGELAAAVPGDQIREYTYDGLGRLAQTRYLDATNGDTLERYVYDGVRRLQTDEAHPPAGGADPVFATTRQYIWGPGDGGIDELLMIIDGNDESWWAIMDETGDLVALANTTLEGQPGQILAQWTYGPYGELIAVESVLIPDFGQSPEPFLGHKGLFKDVLSGSESVSTVGSPALIHNRHRVLSAGRFLQADPHRSGLPGTGMMHGGRAASIWVQAPDVSIRFADGLNLRQYNRSNPIVYSDPTGLAGIIGFFPDATQRAAMQATAARVAHGGLVGARSTLARAMANRYAQFAAQAADDIFIAEWAGVGSGAGGAGLMLARQVNSLGGSGELLELTGRAFRENLSRLTGFAGRAGGEILEAHHIIPQQFRNRIKQLTGQNLVDNPLFGQWIDIKTHRGGVHGGGGSGGIYNREWDEFLANLEAMSLDADDAAQRIIVFASDISRRYGFTTAF